LDHGLHEIDRLNKDYPLAFERYERLKLNLPASAKASEPFGGNLTIRVNDFADGVCLATYRHPIGTRLELDLHVDLLRKAQLRGAELMRAAAALCR
jgi:hypothetical protein